MKKYILLSLSSLIIPLFYQCEEEKDLEQIIEIIDQESPIFEELSPQESPDISSYGIINISELLNKDLMGKKIVEIAESEIGRGPNDVGQDLDFYPYKLNNYISPDDAWCSEFVAWVYKAAGWPLTGGTYDGWMINHHTKMKDWFFANTQTAIWHQNGLKDWNIFNPRPGDYIRFIWSSTGGGHSGIIRSVSGNTLYTVEGNYSNSVKFRTINNWRNYGEIDGIGSRMLIRTPDFDGKVVKIKNVQSEKYLKVKNNSNYVYQDDEPDEDIFNWKIIGEDDGYYKIESCFNELILDANKNSSYLRVFNDNDASDKKWIILGDGYGNYYIKNKEGGFLDINSTESDDYVRLFDNNYKVDKYWNIVIFN